MVARKISSFLYSGIKSHAEAKNCGIQTGLGYIDNDFRNPVVFAREVAVVDVLSGGRLELGIGAGWLDRDYQGTGIPFDRGRVRVARLAEAVTLLKRLFTEEQVDFAGTYYSVTKAEWAATAWTFRRPAAVSSALRSSGSYL